MDFRVWGQLTRKNGETFWNVPPVEAFVVCFWFC